MLSRNKVSLRPSINEHCKTCIYDPASAGTWRQQVTICSVVSCNLYSVRPVTKLRIPESVLDYYSVTGPERDRFALRNMRDGRFSDETSNREYLPTAGHALNAS